VPGKPPKLAALSTELETICPPFAITTVPVLGKLNCIPTLLVSNICTAWGIIW